MSAQIDINSFLFEPEPRIRAIEKYPLFQIPAVKHLIRWPQTICGLPTGSGKSLSVIAALDAQNLFPVNTICSTRVALQWAGEYTRWLGTVGREVRVSILSGRTPRPFEGEYFDTLAGDKWIKVPVNDLTADVLIIPKSIAYQWAETISGQPDRGPRWATARRSQALIIDESHLCRNPQSQQTRAAKYLASWVEPIRYFRHIYGLTADAIVNRPSDLRGICEVLGRKLPGGDYDTFARYFCNRHQVVKIGRDGKIRRHWDDKGSSNELALNRELKRLGLMFRMTREECFPGGPEKQRVMVPVTLSNQAEIQRVEEDLRGYVREMARVRAQSLSEHELRRLVDQKADERSVETLRARYIQDAEYRALRSKALIRLTILRRLVGEGKIEAFIEWLKDWHEENPDEKFIAFAHHVDVQRAIAEAFPSCAWIAGGQTGAKTDEQKLRFYNDPSCWLVVVSAGAGDEGLNLSAASYAAIVEFPWTGKSLNQMEGRNFQRLDNPHGSLYYYFRAANAVEDRVVEIVQGKLEMAAKIMDGREADAFLAQPIQDELLERMEHVE